MTISVFVSGQSNALGRGTGGPSLAGVSSSVSVWNSVNPLGNLGTAFVPAVTAQNAGTFEFTDRNNLGVWFCDRLSRDRLDDVTMTISARGASPIALWSPEETEFPLLENCIDTWGATGQPPADIFLWHQGEGNVETPSVEYLEAFAELITNLTAGAVISANTIILIGGLTPSTEAKLQFNDETLSVAARARSRGYASPSNLGSDGTHFTGEALWSLGAHRYYAAYEFARMARA